MRVATNIPGVTHTVAEVGIPLPLAHAYSYRVPDGLAAQVQVGSRVRIPLGKRFTVGYVLALRDGDRRDSGLKHLLGVVGEEPYLKPELLNLIRFCADYYLAPLGLVLRAVIPSGVASRRGAERTWASLALAGSEASTAEATKALTVKQERLLEALRARGGTAELSALLKGAGVGAAVARALAERGRIALEKRPLDRKPPVEIDFSVQPLTPSPDQAKVLAAIRGALEGSQPTTFLLHGVTGSGKSYVYQLAIDAALELGRSALVLVPEIGLTPLLGGAFRRRYGAALAVLHSGLQEADRRADWWRVWRGEARVVVGTRSAIFAPLDRLGLIVVDEEHDGSYKQEDPAPRYHARDLAVWRAHHLGAVAVLGSATPSMETRYQALRGRYRLLSLPQRVGVGELAPIRVVDMGAEARAAGRDLSLSSALLDAIGARRERGEQVLVLLNRRGYAPILLCKSCGAKSECPNCSVALVYHLRERALVCHHCGHRAPPPVRCALCGGSILRLRGFGTERIEEDLKRRFPELRIARLDRDVIRRPGAAGYMLQRFGRGEIDLMVGTQIIAKGHDFHGVTLVGVVSADIGLGIADFRAAERAYQLLSQVAGRAGRGARAGEVIVQTFYPQHYAIEAARRGDETQFLEKELHFRRAMRYPPFSSLVNLVLSGEHERRVLEQGEDLAAALRQFGGKLVVRGPNLAPLARLKGLFRCQILIKAQRRREGQLAVQTALAQLGKAIPARRLRVDVDPQSLL
ncbi:MAG TPA: primosomal protein N' [Acidobacteriota bacterium]